MFQARLAILGRRKTKQDFCKSRGLQTRVRMIPGQPSLAPTLQLARGVAYLYVYVLRSHFDIVVSSEPVRGAYPPNRIKTANTAITNATTQNTAMLNLLNNAGRFSFNSHFEKVHPCLL
jgi:hypothetical protein